MWYSEFPEMKEVSLFQRRKQHKHERFGLDTRREKPQERAIFLALCTLKQENPNTNFSKHKLSGCTPTGFQKVYACDPVGLLQNRFRASKNKKKKVSASPGT